MPQSSDKRCFTGCAFSLRSKRARGAPCASGKVVWRWPPVVAADAGLMQFHAAELIRGGETKFREEFPRWHETRDRRSPFCSAAPLGQASTCGHPPFASSVWAMAITAAVIRDGGTRCAAGALIQQSSTWCGRSEQISLDQVGCEARKIPAEGDAYFLDFYLYRTRS
jgi:hypothetical protein